MNFKEIFGETEWKEWIEACHITEEQLKKLKTKHSEYVIESVHYISDTYIGMKYRITFFQNHRIVDIVELQAYGIDVKTGPIMLGNIYANLNIWKCIMDKIDEYRNDGIYPKRPTLEEFLQAYAGLCNVAKTTLRKAGDES